MKQKRKSEYDFCWSWDYVQCLCMYIYINQQFLKVSWVTQVAYWYLIQLVCVCHLMSFWSINNFFSDETPVQILGYCFFFCLSFCNSDWNFNLLRSECLSFDISHGYFLWQDLSFGTKIFWPCDFDLWVWTTFWKLKPC